MTVTYINQSTESGVLTAFVALSDSDAVIDYLSTQGVGTSHIEHIVGEYQLVAVIKNMIVAEHTRSQGTGTELLQRALRSARQHSVDACILVADITEPNEFDLVAWYQRSEFEITGYADDNPVMVRKFL